MPARTAATVGDKVIELEFSCRCRLRRRRGRRRQESFASATALDADATSSVVAEGERARRGDGGATDGEHEEVDEEKKNEGDGDDLERRDAEPEASARVRLVSAGGELLGEARAELAGAPDDWARYPLYSPGDVGTDSRIGSGVGDRVGSGDTPATQTASTSKVTGLDRGGVIPAPPATVRRRWGWRYRRDRSATSRRWLRTPPPSRDVSGEVRLRLGWVPSGLAVTVHRCRAAGGAAAAGTGLSDGTIGLLAGGGPRPRSIVVRAEPGGGAARAHPAEVDMDGNAVEAGVRDASDNSQVPRFSTVSKPSAQDDRLPSGRQEVVPVGGPGAADAVDNSSESFFFVLDTSCLLGGWHGGDIGGDDGGDIGSGDGARLVLSVTTDDATLQGVNSTAAVGAFDSAEEGETSNSASLASAELLLFPGAEPARRWVQLTDTVGDTLGEVDITVAWMVAPPLPPLSQTRRSSSSVAAIEPQDQQEDPPVMTDTTAATTTGSLGSSPEALLAPDEETSGNGDDEHGGNAGAAADGGDAGKGGLRAGAGADGDGDGGVEPFPEPAQVVSRCFSMHASDLVLRVSDLDVAVLVTMAKGIVRVGAVFKCGVMLGCCCCVPGC